LNSKYFRFGFWIGVVSIEVSHDLQFFLVERNLAYILPIGNMDIAIVFFGMLLMKGTSHAEGHQAMGVIYQRHYWFGGIYSVTVCIIFDIIRHHLSNQSCYNRRIK